MTMPAVQALRRTFPAAKLSWLVEGSVGELLSHQAFLDRVIEFPRGRIEGALRKGNLFSAGRMLSAFVRDLRTEEYDVVLDFHGIVKSALLARTARTARRIGFDATFAKEASWLAYDEKIGAREKRVHKVRRNMLLCAHLGAQGAPDVEIAASPEAAAYIDQFLVGHRVKSPFIAVNPFCSKGSEFKRWNLANYGELIRRVGDETRATMMILWGPGEEAEARSLAQLGQGRAMLACPTTVSQALALLKRTALYVGGDTGVMHLAALAGVPVVAIFGPTDHLVNGPYGDGHTIVRTDVSCSPCRDKGCKERECLRSITVDAVFRAVMSALDRAGRN